VGEISTDVILACFHLLLASFKIKLFFFLLQRANGTA